MSAAALGELVEPTGHPGSGIDHGLRTARTVRPPQDGVSLKRPLVAPDGSRRPIVIPGALVTRFTEDVAYIREVA